MKPVTKLDIDWNEFNKLLDHLVPFVKYDLESKDKNTVLPGVLDNYTPEVCTYNCYMDEKINNFITDDFLSSLDLDPSSCVAKVLEHKPGTFSVPHHDYYKQYMEQKQITDTSIVRLWIPCLDGQIGHALMFENQVIYNYKAGDVYIVPGDQIHSGVNAGITNRRVITVTGIKLWK